MKDKNLFTSVVIFLVLIIIPTLGLFTPVKIILSPLFTALMIIYALNPFVRFMKNKGLPGGLSTVFVGIMVIFCVSFLFVIIFPKAKSALENIYVLIMSFLDGVGVKLSGNLVSSSVGAVFTTAKGLIRTSVSAAVGAATAFYVLKDTESIKHSVKEVIPEKLKPSFKILCDDIKLITDSFFKGQIIVALILCFMVAILLYSLKIPYAFGLGIIAGALDIIPYAGAFIAMAVILCVVLLSVPEMIVFAVIGLLLIQQIENHVITPKVSQNTLNLHPAIVVPVLYIGSFGGFWGILLSVPIACTIKKLLERLIQSII